MSKLYKYKDYNEYKKVQVEGCQHKVDRVWADRGDITTLLSSYILDYNPDVSFGLCHGTRRGIEQAAFIDGFRGLNKSVKVIGTEIAPEAANDFLNTIEWDFHEVKDDWLGSVDFVYSNAFDHSYNPPECLKAWMSCLGEKGLCILEWTTGHIPSSRLDPFGATFDEYKELIESNYEIIDILKTSSSRAGIPHRHYFVLRNKKKKKKEIGIFIPKDTSL